MKAAIRSEVLTEFAQLERLANEWERLWSRNPRREIFTKFAWARAWWQGYGPRRSLCAPAVFNGNRLIGILPVVAEGRTLRFLGTPRCADYNDLLCEPDASSEVLEHALWALYNLQRSWDRCVLENVSESSQIVTLFEQLYGRLRSRLYLASGSSCSSVVLEGRHNEVLGEILRKKSLRRHQNNLRKRGKLSFRHLEDTEEIKLHLPTFFQQHIARWAMVGSESLFSHKEERTFYYALVDELDPRTELRFAVLELDGRPIAYHLGFELQGKFIFYKPTFDVNLWNQSAGEVLLRCLFEYVAARDIREFDFTIGNEVYKDRFANHVSSNYCIYLYPSGPRGSMLHLCMRAEERAKLKLKQNPRLFLVIKATVAGVKRIYCGFSLVLRHHGLWALSKKLIAQIFRTTVFARDEVLVFSCEKEAQIVASDHLEVRPGTLAELATLSVKYSGFLDVPGLHEARERLNRGDRLYIAQDEDNFICLAWMGIRNVVTALEVGSECRIELDEPISLIYDCWTPPAIRGDGIYPRLLQRLVSLALEEHRQVWIYCRNDDLAARSDIEKAGFQLRHMMGQIQLFHWVRRTWVRSCNGERF